MTKPHILVLRQKIHGSDASEYATAIRNRLPDATVILAKTPGEEREALREADIATGARLTEADLEVAEHLDLFACVFAGTSHLDMDAFTERDVAVTSASGVHGPNMAEHVVGGMIAHAHDFRKADRQQRRHEWRSYQTKELTGLTATIVGLGPIGETIADRLTAFNMNLVGVRYSPEKGGPMDQVYGYEDIHEAVVDAEYVVLICPLTAETEGLIDADVFRTMTSEAVLINVARGPVVDTDALVDALRWNRISGAILDVVDPEPLPAEHPLWNFENVFITPHNSGYTPHYFDRCADILAENVATLQGEGEGPLRNQVN